jgi:hypothetical protein
LRSKTMALEKIRPHRIGVKKVVAVEAGGYQA